MAKELLHEDFGEKIGGAKKDLWAARGLYVDDLLEMNEREAEKYVKKDNVWKKPNYQALIQSGESPDILYFKKVIRDSLNASPRFLRTDDTPEKRLFRQKEYIATVRERFNVNGRIGCNGRWKMPAASTRCTAISV